MIDYLDRAPFIKALLPYTGGIVVATFLPASFILWFIIISLLLLMVVSFVILKPGYYRNLYSGALISIFFCTSAIVNVLIHDRTETWHEDSFYLATLLEKPVEKSNSFRAEAVLTQSGCSDTSRPVRKNIIIYFKKEPRIDSLYSGIRLLFSRSPQEVENPGNPFEFDYRQYLSRMGIERQVYLQNKQWQVAGNDSVFRLRIIAEKARDKLMAVYSRNGIKGAEYEILSALTLGYKKSLDQDIRDAFTATGSIHVLAVSGLHVAIVYLIFNMVFGFLRRQKAGRLLFPVLAIITLWIFAFLTGLSPSVQRSALMFSLVLIGDNLRRPSNIYNTLASSAFILLVINPGFIFDVGFQLSYAAVTGIVYFQPRLTSLFDFKSKIVRYLWELLTVTISAQIATFPLTCFYFQQFPVYFWLANFFVIPGSFILTFLGILVLVVSPAPVISGFLASITGFLVRALYMILQFIENLPGALLTGFYFTAASMVISFSIIIVFILFIESKKVRYLFVTTILFTAFCISDAITKIIHGNHSEIIAYKYNEPVLHLILGRLNYIVASGEILKNGFPGREVKAVSTHFRLKDPVLLPIESDFSDATLVKQGNFIFFNGEVIAIQKSRIKWNNSILPDVIIIPPDQSLESGNQANAVYVCYGNHFRSDVDPGRIHLINKSGAWRKTIDLKERKEHW